MNQKIGTHIVEPNGNIPSGTDCPLGGISAIVLGGANPELQIVKKKYSIYVPIFV